MARGLSRSEERRMKAQERASRRYRLSEEEAEIIDTRRGTGIWTIPDKYGVKQDRAVAKLSGLHAGTKKRYRAALEEIDALEAQLEAARHLKASTFKPIINIGPRASKGKSETIPVLVACDWHYGQVIDHETVNGLNRYDTKTAQQSIVKFFGQGAYLIDMWRGRTKIKECVLAFCGDLMSGEIHAELAESNELYVAQWMVDLRDMIRCGITGLLKLANLERITCVWTLDNHGRTTKKKRSGTAYKKSYSFTLGSIIASDYRDNARVQWKLSKGYHNYVKLFGRHTIRFHHGDEIQYYGGVGGIAVPANKRVDKWNKALRADLDIFGHFHHYRYGGAWISAPAMVGIDAYAWNKGLEPEEPAQLFVAIERDKGLTAHMPILLGQRMDGKTNINEE